MKKLILSIAAIAMIALFSSSVMAQVTASATAAGTIITPIAISQSVDMNFGNVAPSGTAGTVVLSTAAVRTETGGVTLPATTGTVAAAEFDVTGEGVYTYAITLPAGDHTISSGGDNMTVNTFTSDPAGTGALTAGAQTILVGATLNVGINQASGSYISGTGFDVTVNYN